MTTLTMQDEKRLEAIQTSVSRRADGGASRTGDGGKRAAVLPDQARVDKAGAKGVVHGNRGRPCKRKTKEKTVKRVVELARGKYQGFNDHHLTEKLKEQEKIELSREKVRRILRAHGIGSPKKRRGIKHRSRQRKTSQ